MFHVVTIDFIETILILGKDQQNNLRIFTSNFLRFPRLFSEFYGCRLRGVTGTWKEEILPVNRLPTVYEFGVAAVYDWGLIGEWAKLNVTLSSVGENQGG